MGEQLDFQCKLLKISVSWSKCHICCNLSLIQSYNHHIKATLKPKMFYALYRLISFWCQDEQWFLIGLGSSMAWILQKFRLDYCNDSLKSMTDKIMIHSSLSQWNYCRILQLFMESADSMCLQSVISDILDSKILYNSLWIFPCHFLENTYSKAQKYHTMIQVYPSWRFSVFLQWISDATSLL